MEQPRRAAMYTPYEVARALRVSRSTVYRLVRRGDLPAIKLDHLIRIDAEGYRTFLKSRLYTHLVNRAALYGKAPASSSGRVRSPQKLA